MKRLLLLSPSKFFDNNRNIDTVKYHLLSLMTHIFEYAAVKIIDFDIELKCLKPISKEQINAFLSNAEKILEIETFDYVGISCYTSYDYLCTIALLKICNRINPRAILIVGGWHPTAIPGDFCQKEIPVDYIVRGEGEIALQQIIESGTKVEKGPVVLDGPPLDLSSEKRLLFERYPYKSNAITLSLSRGCFYKCSFCVQSHSYSNHFRFLSASQVVEKIKNACMYGNIKSITFIDSFFGANKQMTVDILKEIKQRFASISFWAETRIDYVCEDIISNLKGLNFTLYLGVESLADDTILLMKKSKKPDDYVYHFFQAIDLCIKYGVLSIPTFIMNFPGETVQSYLQTMNRIKKALDSYKEVNFRLHFNQFRLFPGNEVYQKRKRLSQEVGFHFSNDKWWKEEGEDVRNRSSQCMASGDIIGSFGYDNRFWRKDAALLIETTAGKYGYKAYKYHCIDEIVEFMTSFYRGRSINRWELDNYKAELSLLTTFRFALKDFYFSYRKMVAVFGDELITVFTKIFEKIAADFQTGILKKYNNNIDIDTLDDEIKRTVKALSLEEKFNLKSTGCKDCGNILPFIILGNKLLFSLEEKKNIEVFRLNKEQWQDLISERGFL